MKESRSKGNEEIMNSHIGKVEEYFNQHARVWHDLYEQPRDANDVVLRNRMNIAVQLIQKYIPKGANVLDAGCGAGLIGLQLAKKGYTVHSLDISPEMIAICKENFNSVFNENHPHQFTIGDFSKLDPKKGTFKAIIALGFLQYQEDENAILEQLNSLLESNGVLIVSGPMKLAASRFLTSFYLKIRRKPPPPSVSLHLYSSSRLKKLLTPHGFKVTDTIRHGFAGFPLVERLTGLRGGLFVNKLMSILSVVLPIKAFCNDIVAAAVKVGKSGVSAC